MVDRIESPTLDPIGGKGLIEDDSKKSGRFFGLFDYFNRDQVQPVPEKNAFIEMADPKAKAAPTVAPIEEDSPQPLFDLFDKLKEIKEETGLPFEQILQAMMFELNEIREDQAALSQLEIAKIREVRKQIGKERTQDFEDTLKKAQQAHIWNVVKQAFSLIQTALGVSAAATAATPATILLSLFVIGEAADSFFDDVGKREVLNFFYYALPVEKHKKQEYVDKTLGWVRTAVGFASMLALNKLNPNMLAQFQSLNSTDAQRVIQGAQMGLQTTSSLIEAKVHFTFERSQGRLVESSFKLDQQDKKFIEKVKSLGSQSEGMHKNYQDFSRMLEKNHGTSLTILRNR